jgi:hypothetical protein
MGKLPISADLREKNGSISGVVHTPHGDAEILKGSFSSGVISFTVDAGGDDLVLSGKVSINGSIAGKVSGGFANGTFELKRVGDLPAQTDLAPIIRQSKDKWREDLRFLAAELPKKHKNAFNRISKEQWESSVAALDARISEMADEEIILALSRIVAQIGDGHTSLGWARLFPRLPIRYFWFGKELRVIQVGNEYPQIVGASVVKINGVDVDKIYESTRPYIAQNESEEYVLNSSAFLMTYPLFLKNLAAGKTVGDEVKLDFVSADGKRSSLIMKPTPPEADIQWLQAYKTPPQYLIKPEAPFYFEYLPESKTLYVNFKWYPRKPEFRKFSDELFAFIDKNDVQKLVFDFRQNGGGDFTRGREFFIKPIKERKKFLERGHLFAITGRRTFSAGMSNAADFRNELHAILVGEPTGARPNAYQENRGFSLPNSHLAVSYSVELYKFAETDTPGLIPDKIIRPDWESYAAGRDPVLEWITRFK